MVLIAGGNDSMIARVK